MFPKYRPPTFRGDYHQVGYQHAKWWIKYLTRPGCEDYILYFASLLKRSWQPRFTPLLENTESFAPEVCTEIHGMAHALVNHGFKTNYHHVFANCLGETGYNGAQCTAFVARGPHGLYLAHNEEEDGICPLCIARVEISAPNDPEPFVAASYPFQLFGSAFGGLNRYLAFQGNSIGYSKYVKTIELSWSERVPKTVFTRRFLEATSLHQILAMCDEWLFSLPSHHFIITGDKLYSLEIRPLTRHKLHPLFQAELKEVEDVHCHANHFIKSQSLDRDWTWISRKDVNEGIQRLEYCNNLLYASNIFSNKKCIDILKTMAANKLYKWKTSSTFVVDVKAKHSSLTSNNYFNKGIHKIKLTH